jgi:hypothetical protein
VIVVEVVVWELKFPCYRIVSPTLTDRVLGEKLLPKEPPNWIRWVVASRVEEANVAIHNSRKKAGVVIRSMESLICEFLPYDDDSAEMLSFRGGPNLTNHQLRR